jgi:hypothetical protein
MSYYSGWAGRSGYSRYSYVKPDLSKKGKYHPNRCPNREAGLYATARISFKCNSMFGEWHIIESRTELTSDNQYITTENQEIYVVYSYGHHWPMYVYDPLADQWYGNKDKFSQTTSIHSGDAMPRGVYITYVGVEDIKDIAAFGVVEHIAAKMRQETEHASITC